MNINKSIPIPQNINISHTKNQGSCIVTWLPVKDPEDKKIIQVAYNVYRGTSINGIFYKQNSIVMSIINFCISTSNFGFTNTTKAM